MLPPRSGLLDTAAAAAYLTCSIRTFHRRYRPLLEPTACELLPNRSWRHLYDVEKLAPLVATEAACPPPAAPPTSSSATSSAT